MGVKDFNHNVQEFFDLCRKGNAEAVTNWIQLKTKSSKSPLNFLRPTTPCPGWLTSLRDPSTSYTALHQASLHGHCDIVKLLVEQDQELVASKDRRGCLPIHLASWNGHVQVVEELLRADIGAINSVNNAKESPLHLAAQHGYGGVVSLLLKNRGNAQLRNARFETALDIAVRTGKENICKLLICYCPELVLQSAAECSTADNRTISAKIVYPLHSAARYGHTECLSVLCDSGFNVNYVTEEGSAVHVAAVFGQIESVRLLLSHGVDLGIKDSNGMTVLEKLEYYETRQHTDLTQVIQSKDSWAACKEMIEEFLGNSKSNVLTKANNNASSQSSKPVIWKTLPENSRAPDQKRTSSKCASTTSHNNQAGTSTSSTSRSNGHHPTAPTVVRPVFPITSPNMLGRSAVVPKRMKGSLPSGLIPVDQNPSNTLPTTCSYQAPPLYDAWTQPKPQVYNNVDNLISAQPPLPLSYDNVPRNLFIYDNAPPPNHRRWDHDCCVSQAKPGPISQNPTTISGGTARTDFLSHLCEDGSQTTPVKPTAATRLSVLQVFGGNNGSSKPQAHVSDSISADLLLSFGSPTKHLDGECSQVPSTFSTLERDGDYEGEVCADGEAPLALPEKGGSTSASSIVSISPERVVNLGFAKVHDAIDRRSTTLSSNTRSTRSSSTLILDKQDASESIIKEEADEKPMTNATCLEKEEPSRHLALTAITPTNARLSDDELISPTATELSDNTIASSCSLQMISQISSTPPSPIDVQTIFKASPSPSRSISIDQNKKKYSWFKKSRRLQRRKKTNNMDSLHAHLTNTADGSNIPDLISVSVNGGKHGKGLGSQGRNNQVASMDHSAEWRKKESQIINWLLSTGLPKPIIHDIGYVLENNGFDNVHLMKGSLTVNLMTELGFDRSVIHRLDAFITLKMKENIKSVDEFEYLSDWLDSLCLIDHLGPFAKANLTYTSDILAARLTRSDLEKMGVLQLGHIARIIRSLELANFKSTTHRSKHLHANSISDTTEDNNGSLSSPDYLPTTQALPSDFENVDERQTLLMDSCISFSAHYLGSVEISNVEGAEDCRRAMRTSKKRIKQVNKVPQVILEISVGGVNILDSTTNQLTVQHEINRIQVVCQDELDLNCFAYIYQDGDKNFCHVYCVLTAMATPNKKRRVITLEEKKKIIEQIGFIYIPV